MNGVKYTVLIRTFNSENTLLSTLDGLANQSIRPSEYIFVDSGSTDRTLSLIPKNAIIHRYVGADFNYSDAINQGVTYLSTDYVMIISSHTLLENCHAIEFALNILQSNETIGAAYFSQNGLGELTYQLIDKHNFTGFNGLHNTASVIKSRLLKLRGFRLEVFSAEDQEWASWLFHSENKATACIFGAGGKNNNPRKRSISKQLNEYVAIAYFANKKLLSFNNLFRVAYGVVKLDRNISLAERLFNLKLFFRLISCYFKRPQYKSRYF
jgi:glycosyltransferase involved in cell wall biosynthesis